MMLQKLNNRKIALFLGIYGIAHAFVDAASIYFVLGILDSGPNLLYFIVLYNILAFGLQLPLGIISDRIRKPFIFAIAGCIFIALGLKCYFNPVWAVLIVGAGNALFHVGGGTIALNLKPEKASLPGLFVAPGGIGLFIGGVLARKVTIDPSFIILAFVIFALIMLLLKQPPINYHTQINRFTKTFNGIVLLILIVICLRSFIGLSITFEWKKNASLALISILAIALGKGFGGFLADYFGWIKISVSGLLLSALLFLFGGQNAFTGILAFFLFNLTMPVTLVCISNIYGGRPGFAFGLTTFALLIGALPTFLPIKEYLTNFYLVTSLIIVASMALYWGLNRYQRENFV